MTGDVKPNSADVSQYKYTCCKNEPTDGMQCGDYDNDGCLPGEVRKSSPDGRYECITEERNKLEVYFAIICTVVILGIFGLFMFCCRKDKDKGQEIIPTENIDERTDESTNDEKVLQMVPPQPLSQTVETIDLQQETVKICLDTNVWPKEKDKRKWGSSLLSPFKSAGYYLKNGLLLLMNCKQFTKQTLLYLFVAKIMLPVLNAATFACLEDQFNSCFVYSIL